jgi:exonuclease III
MRLVTWNVNGLKAAERRCGSLQRLLNSIDAGVEAVGL